MKQNLFNVIALLATSTLVGINNPANATPSNYQKSCNNISVFGNVLSANCSRTNGSFNKTSIVLRGIENINGTFKVTDPGKVSNYQFTCQNIRIRGNDLKAACKSRNGTLKWTSTVLQGIENINGVLKYSSSP
ncbi:CVNH domain-containing protein [Nostoc sp. 'Lobaria pulmonaria (5183) cyanobiont']|uniref:mannose-binding lectin n=1 Tax=Nostoc sp. 'Lobaria pulmonaria (5183) cyanobiont' TaxID=1618022 RepID=UPI000CF30E38|nr:CVNH domain-containing protein [Nostoc sp. 'Lobaria pulmonaria (5183) cyanobiont']AVH74012.1 cyanovirin-N domain protein [Nostoc sp. 'Lobaria pulmonaria (5183) cyanobiont']